jgi:antitoxin component HigA of HigAB toxin-antitoxin module
MGPEQYSRQQVVDVLRHAGWSDIADEASRTLPDPVNVTALEAWATQHGFSFEDLKSRFGSRGGSP